jgi:hypothetical protein
VTPDESADLDAQLKALLRRNRRVQRAAEALIALVLVGAVTYLLVALAQDSARIAASCHFWSDLGPAPVTVSPATGKPSLLGVRIISDSRVAWHGQDCGGVLPPPDPSFVRWAKYYRLPVG